MVTHCGSDLHYLVTNDVLIDHLYVFSEEILIQITGPLFKLSCLLLLICKSSFYILDTSPLSDIQLAQTFSYSVCSHSQHKSHLHLNKATLTLLFSNKTSLKLAFKDLSQFWLHMRSHYHIMLQSLDTLNTYLVLYSLQSITKVKM